MRIENRGGEVTSRNVEVKVLCLAAFLSYGRSFTSFVHIVYIILSEFQRKMRKACFISLQMYDTPEAILLHFCIIDIPLYQLYTIFQSTLTPCPSNPKAETPIFLHNDSFLSIPHLFDSSKSNMFCSSLRRRHDLSDLLPFLSSSTNPKLRGKSLHRIQHNPA